MYIYFYRRPYEKQLPSESGLSWSNRITEYSRFVWESQKNIIHIVLIHSVKPLISHSTHLSNTI